MVEDDDENEDENDDESEGGHLGYGASRDDQQIRDNVTETPETDESAEADAKSSELVVLKKRLSASPSHTVVVSATVLSLG